MSAAGSTTSSVTTDDTLGVYVPAPVYSARRLCDPVASIDVLSAAVPPLSVTLPIVRDPSKNSTEPVSVPPSAVTVAVSVAHWFASEVLGDTVSAVLVGVWTVRRKTAPPVLAPPEDVVP